MCVGRCVVDVAYVGKGVWNHSWLQKWCMSGPMFGYRYEQ